MALQGRGPRRWAKTRVTRRDRRPGAVPRPRAGRADPRRGDTGASGYGAGGRLHLSVHPAREGAAQGHLAVVRGDA